MGKMSNIVKVRKCLNCGQNVDTDSKGLKKHFLACCRKSRGLDKQVLPVEESE